MAEIYKSAEGKRVVEELYERALQQWPVPVDRFVLPTRAGDTFVLASGDPRTWPVVLLHGSGTNSAAWIRDVAEWSKSYRVYAIDLIGEAGFSAPSRPQLASDVHACWLEDVWQHLGLAQASLVGVSLGGWLALDYAVRRPGKVASLTLLSPSGVGGQNMWLLVRVGLLRMFGTWGLRRSFALIAGRNDLPRALTDRLVSVFRHFRPRMERIPVRSDEELASLRMPIQLILGGKDALLRSQETRARFEQLSPDVRVIWLESEGHLLPPQTTAISEFLTEVSHRRQSQRGGEVVSS